MRRTWCWELPETAKSHVGVHKMGQEMGEGSLQEPAGLLGPSACSLGLVLFCMSFQAHTEGCTHKDTHTHVSHTDTATPHITCPSHIPYGNYTYHAQTHRHTYTYSAHTCSGYVFSGLSLGLSEFSKPLTHQNT